MFCLLKGRTQKLLGMNYLSTIIEYDLSIHIIQIEQKDLKFNRKYNYFAEQFIYKRHIFIEFAWRKGDSRMIEIVIFYKKIRFMSQKLIYCLLEQPKLAQEWTDNNFVSRCFFGEATTSLWLRHFKCDFRSKRLRFSSLTKQINKFPRAHYKSNK